tara:strand:+ start:223 stop:372 length:150 start_codon:yes stop_codon:yes gene_type:complete
MIPTKHIKPDNNAKNDIENVLVIIPKTYKKAFVAIAKYNILFGILTKYG